MQWGDVGQPHRKKVRMEVGGLLSIALDRLPGQFSFGVLREEVIQQFSQCFRKRNVREAGLSEFELLLLGYPSLSLGVLSFALRAEPRLLDLPAVLRGGIGGVKNEAPDSFAVLI